MTLDDVEGDWKEIFLDYEADRNPQGRMETPKIFYKVLIDKQKNTGVVLVGNIIKKCKFQLKKSQFSVANAYFLDLNALASQNYILCKGNDDVSSQLNWINFKNTDLTRGFGYACRVSDFVEKIPALKGQFPDVDGLLQ